MTSDQKIVLVKCRTCRRTLMEWATVPNAEGVHLRMETEVVGDWTVYEPEDGELLLKGTFICPGKRCGRHVSVRWENLRPRVLAVIKTAKGKRAEILV